MNYLNQLLPDPLKGHLQLAWASVQTEVDSSVLLKEELKLYESYQSAERKQEFLVGRHIAKQIAADIGLNPEELLISKDEEGKPVARYQGKLYFISITHSDEMVMCALSDDMVIGIDIEPSARQIPTELRERIISDVEHNTMQGVNTLRIWTMKEALLKLHGKALESSLKECVIHASDTDIYEAEVKAKIKARVFSKKHRYHWIAIAW